MAEHFKMTFTIEAQNTGLVASFYDDPGDRLGLADSAATAFKDDPENAEIFLHVKAGKWCSAQWLLNWFFNKKGKKAEDYLPADAHEKAFELGEHTSPQKFRLEFDKGVDVIKGEKTRRVLAGPIVSHFVRCAYRDSNDQNHPRNKGDRM